MAEKAEKAVVLSPPLFFSSLIESHVKVLRKFRDRCLLTNSVGKNFIRLYYSYSTPIADFIAKHDNLRAMMRWSLLPVVGVSWVAFKIGLVLTMALMLLFCMEIFGLVRARRKFRS